MRTEQSVRKLITQLYRDLGEDPAGLKSIKPVGGDWASASSYEVTRTDGAVVSVAGKDIDKLKAAHIAAHQKLFRRVSLDLGTSASAALPRSWQQQPSSTALW